jgi:glycosyltransferase involved in cell wall biosynthesis
MKICMVGLGQNPIPPTGWGAVEIIIWDYKQILEKLGHEVVIVNTPNREEIINICNSENPDFVHIQYDVFWDICESLDCKNVAITSHYGYIDQEDKYDYGYFNIFKGFLSFRNTKIFALSPSNAEKYKKYGFDPDRVKVTPNGVRDDLFKFSEECEYPGKSIYLAKIEPRKRQFLFHNIDDLYFAGNVSDSRYNQKNHLGEWSKEYLYDNLTKYGNLVLLSDGEAHPLVCMEAMSAGLGLVLSEWSTANLDLSLPFIDVIPESRINDIEYISKVIKVNREKSIKLRKDIRKYSVENFSWNTVINKYLKSIKE